MLTLYSCSDKYYRELVSKCEIQSGYEKIAYKAVYKNASSFNMDTVTTTTHNYLIRSVGDTIYPYEFLNIDDEGNFISYLEDTVYSYNSAFNGQYYDLAKIYGHEMVADGYKYNTLLPQLCADIDEVESVKWKRRKRQNQIFFFGTSKLINRKIIFDSKDYVVSSQYSYWSDSYHYFGQHTFSDYQSNFDADTVRLKSGNLLNFEVYRKQQEDLQLERQKKLIQLPLFNDLDGQEIDITKEGDLFILDFFFNGCVPCIESVPKLNELYAKVGERIPMYGINGIDKSAEAIKHFQSRYGVEYPLLMTDSNLIATLRINAYPELLVIKNGEIVYRHIGTLHSTEDVVEFLQNNQ